MAEHFGESPLRPHETRPWFPDIRGHQQGPRSMRRPSRSVQEQLDERTRAMSEEIFGK